MPGASSLDIVLDLGYMNTVSSSRIEVTHDLAMPTLKGDGNCAMTADIRCVEFTLEFNLSFHFDML
jgi:hypothetical protein